MTYSVPVVGRISQYFGTNANSYQPGGHTGVDYAIPEGTPIHSIGDGVVRHADWASRLGWPNPYYIAIDFDGPSNGDQSAGIIVIIDHGAHVSIYAHLSETPLNPGDRVKKGQVIALSGNTGRSSGPHLHFEILPNGWNVHNNVYGRINPLPLLTGTISNQSTPTPSPEDEMTPAQMQEIKIFMQNEMERRHLATRDTIVTETNKQAIETRKQVQAMEDVTRQFLADRFKEASATQVADAIPVGIAEEVVRLLTERLAK